MVNSKIDFFTIYNRPFVSNAVNKLVGMCCLERESSPMGNN